MDCHIYCHAWIKTEEHTPDSPRRIPKNKYKWNTNVIMEHIPDRPGRISKIRVITKLANSEQSYKGKVKTHKYINRQNQSTTGKL
jgi:hypothetical protein